MGLVRELADYQAESQHIGQKEQVRKTPDLFRDLLHGIRR